MKEIIRKIILVICVCVFVYSAYQLCRIFYEYYLIEKQTEGLIAEYIETVDPDEVENDSDDPYKRIINFKELKQMNEDVIAWLYIPDTKIDEPVLKGENNETYIRTGIDKKPSHAGCIFIDEINEPDFQDQNTIFYGHRLKNGSRFHNIGKYVKKDFFDEHPYIYLYLPDGSLNVYKIYAISELSAYSELYHKDIDYQQYIQTFLENAIQKCEISEEEAPLIMLSTCVAAEGDARYALSARLEKQVTRNENDALI